MVAWKTEREREREIANGWVRGNDFKCVCVCEREREREGEGVGEKF